MFDIFLDYIKKTVKSRLLPITLIYFILFAFVIHRLFVIQIVEGPVNKETADLKDSKEREIKSTRGNIYDRKGMLLAYNKLSYSIVMENISASNEQYNEIINKLVNIIEKNGDTLDNQFNIIQNENGDFEFTVDGNSLTKFKKDAYTYALTKDKQLTEEQQNATAKDVFDFLRYGTDQYPMFQISDKYTEEEALKIMGIRFTLLFNFPKYNQIVIASNLSEKTVAAVLENSADLQGVEIQQQTSRAYNDSEYFAHIMGYTGLINSDELEAYKAKGYDYKPTDVIGKTGLEKKYESQLAGTNGKELITVSTSGKLLGVTDTIDPIAGNDLYLTIDSELQKSTYKLLEKEIAQILMDSIVRDRGKLGPDPGDYGSKGVSAADITIPIYEVYFALINNNIIDINAFDNTDSTVLEKRTKEKYLTVLDEVLSKMDIYLSIDNTITNNKTGDMKDFLTYFYKALINQKILIKENIPSDDPKYLAYKNDEISLSSFLQYALANNWIDLTALEIGEEYYSTEELYLKLLSYMKDILKSDDEFNKLIYKNLVFSYKLTGTEICLLLFDQGVLKYNNNDINSLKSGKIAAYDFIMKKLASLEITPGMLALEPCSGSVIITDVNTGEVLALVTYPSYDNNKLANKADSKYYSKLLKDGSIPLTNYALNSKIAPGSTFKMVTSVTSLEEGVTTPTEKVRDLGEFTKITPSARCHVYPSNHGYVTIVDAIKVSCNYFFYEMGWRLSIGKDGKYNSDLGLSKLKKYATLFGLNEKSGIELAESDSEISADDAVRSSIGQGTNLYTPAQLSRYVTTIANRGTCYNLTILDKITDKDGKIVLDNNATVNHKLKIQDSTWNTLYQGMYSVTNVAGGSVTSTFKNFPVTVAGKTGTSQVSKVSPNNALFISFAPYDAPKISITTVIPKGYTSHNAARLTQKIYSYYFGFKDAKTLINSYTDSSSGNGGALE